GRRHGRGLVERRDDRIGPAPHIAPVIGIADGGVQFGELVGVFVDQGGEFPDPADRIDDCHIHTPQRRAGVRTGASQRPSSSSSTLVSVTEHPAISNEVMYGPTSERAISTPCPRSM